MASHLNEKQNTAARAAANKLLAEGYTQTKLCEAIRARGVEISQSTMSSFVHGRQSGTSTEVAVELIRLAGGDPAEVFPLPSQPSRTSADGPSMGANMTEGQIEAMRMVDWAKYDLEPEQMRELHDGLSRERHALGGDTVPEYWIGRITRLLNEIVGRASKTTERESVTEADSKTESAEKRAAKKGGAKR